MSDIPSSPERFFGEYVPVHFAELGGALGEASSPGSVAFEVGSSAWSLRLADGRILVETGVASDTLLRVSLTEQDFRPVIVAGAERLAEQAGLERQLVAARALSLEPDRAQLLRETKGSLLFRLAGDGEQHRVLVSLGTSTPNPEKPECEIECALADLWAIQSGAANPMQLLLDGKVRLQGNLELAMAVGAALS